MRSEFEFDVIYHPVNFKKPQKIYEDDNITVSSFPVKHSIPTCGFLFQEKEKQGTNRASIHHIVAEDPQCLQIDDH